MSARLVDAGESVSRQCLRQIVTLFHPARPEPAETGSFPGSYVEPLSDARTKLEVFFNILVAEAI
jgi:hypothetical protein